MKHWILLFFLALSIILNAQNAKELSQAKIDYKNKEFSKALPIFEREYLLKPTDPSLNLWYGVCLIETDGDKKLAEECLLVASKKNLPEAFLYLGDTYVDQYKASDAEDLFLHFAKLRPKEKETTLRPFQDKLDKMKRAISRTEDIQIIDSIVIDKKILLSAYKLSPQLGALSWYNEFFKTSSFIESTVFQNGKGSKVFFGEPVNGIYSLFSMDKLLSGYGEKKKLSQSNFGFTGDVNYPFVLTDGVTIYFSAISEEGLGGYDIYVTRYDLNRGSFLSPERLNMPFNSTANDYLYIFDEEKGVGWFATDRFQPEGLVCVYTFIPNEEVTLIESDDDKYMESRARLVSIRDSWKPTKDYRTIVQQARETIVLKEKEEPSFTFIVDDDHTYHTLNDFKNAKARNLFQDLKSKQKSLDILKDNLSAKRIEYSGASNNQKSSMIHLVIDLEDSEEQLEKTISDLEATIRNLEIQTLNR